MIRPAVAADFAAIDAFDPFAGDRSREIAEGRMLVAEREGQVAGFISWLPGGFIERDFISFLCVGPAHRRLGLAVTLIHAVEARIGTGRLFISTEADNTVMLTLLPAQGWTNAGTVAGVNEGGGAEVFFYKDLPAP